MAENPTYLKPPGRAIAVFDPQNPSQWYAWDGTLAGAGTFQHGSKNVTSAGTAEAIGTDTPIKMLVVVANPNNTGDVYIGDSTIDSTHFPFARKKGMVVAVDNLNKVYIDADNDGEGVFFWYIAETV